jgi:hypothetical protein
MDCILPSSEDSTHTEPQMSAQFYFWVIENNLILIRTALEEYRSGLPGFAAGESILAIKEALDIVAEAKRHLGAS